MLSKRLFLPLICLLMCSSVYAQVPYTFSSGTAAKAEEVNANFTALENQIGQLQSQITQLSGTQTSITLAGSTYKLFRLGIKLADNGGGNYDIGNKTFSGTVTFNSGGTGTFSSNETNNTMSFNNNTTNGTTSINFQTDPKSNTGTFTWTLNGNSLTITPSGDSPLTFTVSGNIAVANASF